VRTSRCCARCGLAVARATAASRSNSRVGMWVCAPVVIAAPGMVWRRLEAEGFEEFLGRGAYYGAGRSEAMQCAGDPVVVVGVGNSAGQVVMDLAQAGARVTMAVRGSDLAKAMSQYLVERIEQHPNVDVCLNTEVVKVQGDERAELCAAMLRRRGGEAVEPVPAKALFACIGGTPRTGWADDVGVARDAQGYILTWPDLLGRGSAPRPGRWSAIRLRSRRACPGCSRQATRVTAQRSASRALSATGRWRPRSRTAGLPSYSDARQRRIKRRRVRRSAGLGEEAGAGDHPGSRLIAMTARSSRSGSSRRLRVLVMRSTIWCAAVSAALQMTSASQCSSIRAPSSWMSSRPSL